MTRLKSDDLVGHPQDEVHVMFDEQDAYRPPVAATPPKRIETCSTDSVARPQRSAFAVPASASADSMDFPLPSNQVLMRTRVT